MKFLSKDQSLFVKKPEGITVNYYLFNEYEIHYNEQAPHTTQVWHHHEKILETVFIIDGELVTRWKEADREQSKIVKAGDLIETENTPHTFSNETDKSVRFIVFKQVLSGVNKQEILKNDKVIDG